MEKVPETSIRDELLVQSLDTFPFSKNDQQRLGIIVLNFISIHIVFLRNETSDQRVIPHISRNIFVFQTLFVEQNFNKLFKLISTMWFLNVAPFYCFLSLSYILKIVKTIHAWWCISSHRFILSWNWNENRQKRYRPIDPTVKKKIFVVLAHNFEKVKVSPFVDL